MSFGPRLSAFLAVLACAFLGASAAAQAAMDAHGSAKQVYATGLAPNASVKLLDAKGKRIAKQKADAEGGILFRNVKPGSGYRLSAGGARTAGAAG